MTEKGFEEVRLGNSGIAVSSVGFGTYHLREKLGASEAIDAMGAAYEAGITLFDTSDNYGTEELIGLAVREGVLPRDKVAIATKTGLATSAQEHLAWAAEGKRIDTSPDRIRQQVEKSLRLLGEDVGIIDLYQLHGRDPSVFAEGPAMALDKLIQEGKIRAYGVSNYSAEDMTDILCTCKECGLTPPVTSQPFANVVAGYDDEIATEIARSEGMTILAHSPLHKGMLGEEMISEVDDWIQQAKGYDKEELAALKEGLDILEGLSDRAIEAGHNLAQLAVAWLAMHPDTVVLSSPTNSSRLNDAREGANWELGDDMTDALRSAQEKFSELNFSNMTINLMRRLKIYYR